MTKLELQDALTRKINALHRELSMHLEKKTNLELQIDDLEDLKQAINRCEQSGVLADILKDISTCL
jgi:hypothetical protein